MSKVTSETERAAEQFKNAITTERDRFLAKVDGILERERETRDRSWARLRAMFPRLAR
jgi:hypothetical protein